MRPPRRLVAPALLVALLVALVACDAAELVPQPGGPRPQALQGTNWSVVTVAGRAPQQGAAMTIMFLASTARGSGGCNQFGGNYQYDASTGRIAFKELGMTAMACVQAQRMDLEAAYVQALGRATQVDVDADGHLVIGGPGGVVIFAAMLEG